MKKSALSVLPLAATGLLALVLSGCGTGTSPTKTGDDLTPAPTVSRGDDHKAKFGDTVEFDDGLKLTVKTNGTEKLHKKGKADDCHTGDPVRLYKLTYVNDTDDDYDAAEDTTYSLTYENSDGLDDTATEVTDTHDEDHKINGLQDIDPMEPGEKKSKTIGFCVPNRDSSVTLTVDTDRSEYTPRTPVEYKD
ncbi:hypothetical protein [Brevibacterium moorei]|uniref:hypothetical protein n=1 Tax=Brevibacterium moorei TaxID=2968457 RepID=UPI00211D0268|nr:hypothetical protein [Brevibacterium sp. 68QC2CO]MCQ9385387.1 hypothetical protein [Brevibacterium sp. 68QC2CO]